MPSKSKKQARLMAAVAHNPKFAKKVGIPQSVGREFNEADHGRRFAKGGKVDLAKRVVEEMRKVGNRFSRERLERILDENPDAAQYIQAEQLIRLARSQDPLMSLSPEEFLTLASKYGPEGNDVSSGISRRAQNIIKKLNQKEQMRTSPLLEIQFGGGEGPWEKIGPLVVLGHDGRARATALGELGAKRIPVHLLQDVDVGDLRRSKAESINKAKKIINEDTDRDDFVRIRKRAFAEGGKVAQALRFLKLGYKNRETPVLSNPATAEDVGRLKMLMKELYPEDRYLRTWESENNTFAFPASASIHEQAIKALEKEFPDETFTYGLGITLDEMLDQIAKKGRFSGHDSKFDPDADIDGSHPGFADGGKVDLIKRIKELGNRHSVRRMERILDENPRAADVIHPYQMLYLARSDDPVLSMSPLDFLQLAQKDDNPLWYPVAPRAEEILRKLKQGKKVNPSPHLFLDYTGSGLKVTGHDGRARSTAFAELGLDSIPIQLRTGEDDLHRLSKARKINAGERLIPEDIGLSIPIKGRAFADGGRVSNFRRLSKILRDRYDMDLHTHGEYGENTPEYNRVISKWDPRMSVDDAELLTDWGTGALWHWQEGAEEIKRLDELIKKHGIRPRGFTLWRGMEVNPDRVDTLKAGSRLGSHRQTSTSLNEHTAREFSTMGAGDPGAYPTLIRIAPTDKLTLPIPTTGQSELILPSGEAGELLIDKVKYHPRRRAYEIDAVTEPHPGFADGGRVLPSSTEDDEDWTDTYVKRPLSGLASMWGGADPETGEYVNPVWHNLKRAWNMDERRRQGLPSQKRASLGIVDETVSLPALGEIVGLPAPQFAKDAEERASATREAARGSLGLDEPHGFVENLAESAGVMAGQLPVPAAVANRLKLLKEGKKSGKLGKVAGSAVEWFSPTVVPQASNYAKGTAFGGVLGGSLDHLEDYMNDKDQEERHKQFISEAMAEVLAEESGSDETDEEALAELGYAEGGRVKTARKVIGNLRQILSTVDPEDVATRKAAIDSALNAIKGTAGPTDMDRKHLHTMATGLTDAAADPAPARRRQRFGDYERNVLGLLEGRIAPALVERLVPDDLSVISNIGPQPALPQRRAPDPHVRLDRDLGPIRPEQRLDPLGGPDNRHGILTQEEWEEQLNPRDRFAAGGEVGVNKRHTMLPAPQSQKVPMGPQSTSGTGRKGAPLSQEWYENYGAGPEHQFFGERRIPELKDWNPIRQAAPQAPKPSGGSSPLSNILGLASLGLMGYDIYKDIKGRNVSSTALDPENLTDPYGYPIDISGTNDWIQKDFDNMEMPTAEFDPTLWDRTKQGAGGALDLYIGTQQGGVGGAGNMVSGAGDLYAAFGGRQGFADVAGNVGGILSGVGDGTVQGYLQAGGDAVQLAKSMGYTGPVFDSMGNLLPVVGQLFSAYEGIKRGDPAGYAQAAGSLYGAASSAGLTSSTGALASSGLGTAAPLAALGFAAAGAINSALGVGKKGAILDAYLDRLGGRRATIKEARNRPGGYRAGYYVLPDGRLISNTELKDMYKEAGSPLGGL